MGLRSVGSLEAVAAAVRPGEEGVGTAEEVAQSPEGGEAGPSQEAAVEDQPC